MEQKESRGCRAGEQDIVREEEEKIGLVVETEDARVVSIVRTYTLTAKGATFAKKHSQKSRRYYR